jgi:hypothetical protein
MGEDVTNENFPGHEIHANDQSVFIPADVENLQRAVLIDARSELGTEFGEARTCRSFRPSVPCVERDFRIRMNRREVQKSSSRDHMHGSLVEIVIDEKTASCLPRTYRDSLARSRG